MQKNLLQAGAFRDCSDLTGNGDIGIGNLRIGRDQRVQGNPESGGNPEQGIAGDDRIRKTVEGAAIA